jgi:hypothetical protein
MLGTNPSSPVPAADGTPVPMHSRSIGGADIDDHGRRSRAIRSASGVSLSMQPGSGHLSRPDRNLPSIGSPRPAEGPRRRRCSPIACWALHPSERLRVTVLEAVGKRSCSARHGPASASRGLGPGFALSSTHVDRPARDRGSRPSRGASPPLGVHRYQRGVRRCRCLPRGRAPAGPVRRGGSDGGCRADDGVTARAAEFPAPKSRRRSRPGVRGCGRARERKLSRQDRSGGRRSHRS